MRALAAGRSFVLASGRDPRAAVTECGEQKKRRNTAAGWSMEQSEGKDLR
jgi:hypothetical protein